MNEQYGLTSPTAKHFTAVIDSNGFMSQEWLHGMRAHFLYSKTCIAAKAAKRKGIGLALVLLSTLQPHGNRGFRGHCFDGEREGAGRGNRHTAEGERIRIFHDLALFWIEKAK